jgi:hypothetical protein
MSESNTHSVLAAFRVKTIRPGKHTFAAGVFLTAFLTACTHVDSPRSPATGQSMALEQRQAAEGIRAMITQLEKALRDGDANAYAACYAPEASYLNTTGKRVRGRSSIAQELAGLRAGTDFRLPIAGIDYLSSEVAVVDCDVRPLGSRATYTMIRTGGVWLVAAGRILPAERSQ